MSWNSKRPLIFIHIVLTNTLGVRRAKDIRARTTRQMDLSEGGLHAGLVGDAEAKGAAREGRAASDRKEEDESVARSYRGTVLSGKLRKAIRWATNREGGGCLLPDDQCNKTGRPVAEVLQEKHPDMRVPPVKKPACAAFNKYGGSLPSSKPVWLRRPLTPPTHTRSKRANCAAHSTLLPARLRCWRYLMRTTQRHPW